MAVSFTVEQDGRLPDGTPLSAAIAEVDAEGGPDYFMVNCAHPTHIAPGLADAGRLALAHRRASERTRRPAATRSSTPPPSWTRATPSSSPPRRTRLRPHLPNLALVGGCCGTDARHVAAMWGVD